MTNEDIERDFAKAFIDRTEKILSQYKQNVSKNCAKDENFDVTLLVNCLFGLLMMPEKKYNNKLKQFGNARSYLEDSGILENGKVCVSQNVNELTFEQFVRSIRNGLGHWEETQGLGIEYKKNEEGLIDKIVINGSLTVKKEYKTSIEFDVSDTKNVTKFLDLITKG